MISSALARIRIEILAITGGVAGHVAGHHGLAGAAVGCAVGHHMAKKHERQARRSAQLR